MTSSGLVWNNADLSSPNALAVCGTTPKYHGIISICYSITPNAATDWGISLSSHCITPKWHGKPPPWVPQLEADATIWSSRQTAWHFIASEGATIRGRCRNLNQPLAQKDRYLNIIQYVISHRMWRKANFVAYPSTTIYFYNKSPEVLKYADKLLT